MCNGDVDGGGPAVVPALQKEVCRALPAGHTHFVSHLLAGCTNEMEGFHLRRMPRVELVLVAAEEVVAEGISGLAAEGGRTAKERAVFSAGDQPEPETHQNSSPGASDGTACINNNNKTVRGQPLWSPCISIKKKATKRRCNDAALLKRWMHVILKSPLKKKAFWLLHSAARQQSLANLTFCYYQIVLRFFHCSNRKRLKKKNETAKNNQAVKGPACRRQRAINEAVPPNGQPKTPALGLLWSGFGVLRELRSLRTARHSDVSKQWPSKKHHPHPLAMGGGNVTRNRAQSVGMGVGSYESHRGSGGSLLPAFQAIGGAGHDAT